MDDAFAGIGAKMAEMQGQTLDKIAAATDAAFRAVRQQVSLVVDD